MSNKNFKINKISSLPEHLQPIFLKKNKTNKIILLIHGLSSYPWEMSFLAKFLNKKGYSVYVPVISDFFSFKSFRHFSYNYWLNNIKKELKNVEKFYKEIIVVGHSLGGILSIYSYFLSKKVKKIIAISPVIKLRNPFIGLLPLVSWLIKKIPIKTKKEYEKNYFPYFPTKAIYETHKLSKIIRKKASEIKIPILIITSKTDKTISQNSIKKFYNNIQLKNKGLIIYPNAPHSMLTPIYKNRYKVYEEINNFITKN